MNDDIMKQTQPFLQRSGDIMGHMSAARGGLALSIPSQYSKTPVTVRTFDKNPDGGGPSVGAFFTLYTNEDGDIFLQGGTVTGGTGNVPIADFQIYDHITGWVGSAGDHLILHFSGTGIVVDGVLLGGFNLSTVTGPTAGAVGATTVPTAGSASGSGDISLGIFATGAFNAANVGNIQITFCPGSFTITRA